MEPFLTSPKDGWSQPQKILAFLLVATLLVNLGTLTIVAIVGAHIFDVTSSDSLCRTANSCLGKANLQLQDAIVASLDPVAWGRVAGDVAQLAKQLKTVNWTLETSQKCNFLVYCSYLSSVDCPTFKGDKGGVCEWTGTRCQTPDTQQWETTKVTPQQAVGCVYFRDSYSCVSAVPIAPAARCNWDNTQNQCTDADAQNPGRVMEICREDLSISNDTSANINDAISRAGAMAESYRTNSSRAAVSSSLDITQYIAHQLESNWTLTADTCAALASTVLQVNTSVFACQDNLPNCDSWAQFRVFVQAANILCDKIVNVRLVVNQSDA